MLSCLLLNIFLCLVDSGFSIETEDSCIENKCDSIPLYDKRFTLFVHPSIRVSYINDEKKEGLIVTDNIPIGTVLIVEDPWMYSSIDSSKDNFPFFKSKLEIINLIRNDNDIYKLYTETLAMNNKMRDILIQNYDIDNNQDINDLAIFETNSWGSAMYGLLSKLNYDYPTNAVIVGGKNIVNNRIMIIAADNIKQNEEIVYEYFDIFSNKNFDHLLKGYGITLNSAINYKPLQQKYSNKIDAFLTGNQKSIETNSFSKDMEKVYKNCITPAWIIPGGACDKDLNAQEVSIKNELRLLISQGQIMQYALGNRKPKKWMGQSFIDNKLSLKL